MNELGYVPQQRHRNNRPGIKHLYNKRRLVDDVAQLQFAKRTKLKEGTTLSSYGDTCDKTGSHFATDGVRTGQRSYVRNVALRNIVVTAIYLCPFAISERVLCR